MVRKVLKASHTQHAQSPTISAIIFILTVPFQSRFGHSPTNGSHSLSLPKAVHTCLRQPDRTQRLTGVNRGHSDGGGYHYPRSVPHVRKPPRAGCQNGVLCRFWALVGCAPEECREPAEQRCAHARRCSEATRSRWAALPAAASCAASTISEVRYPCTEAQRKNYRLRHTSDCPASLACTLLRAADSSNAQSCRS